MEKQTIEAVTERTSRSFDQKRLDLPSYGVARLVGSRASDSSLTGSTYVLTKLEDPLRSEVVLQESQCVPVPQALGVDEALLAPPLAMALSFWDQLHLEIGESQRHAGVDLAVPVLRGYIANAFHLLVHVSRLAGGQQRRREPESFCDREGLGPTGSADDKSEGRAQRRKVELDRAVHHALRHMGVLLQLGVVTRGKNPHATFAEVVDDRRCERSAFGRVGPSASLVEKDQISGRCAVANPKDRGEMTGKGRETLRNRLVVTDVCPDSACWREARSCIGGNRQPRVVHGRQQPDRLQCHRLPSGVWSGDEQHPLVWGELEIDRHDRAAEQRVAGTTKREQVIRSRICEVPIALGGNIYFTDLGSVAGAGIYIESGTVSYAAAASTTPEFSALGAIVGGAIAASQAEAARQQDYCARRFRSYNPATGTYIAKGGREMPCP